MEPEPKRSTSTSRRDPRSPSSGRPASRGVPRTAVLLALATATIGVPVIDFAQERPSPQVALTEAREGRSVREVLLMSAVQQTTPTSLLAALPGVREVSGSASRSLARDPLPGCDGSATLSGDNGRIASSDLCQLWDPAHMLRGDAAVALSELNSAYRAATGVDLCLTDSYRPLSVQRRLAYTKPGLAAAPGRSNHGWGLAIDLCSSVTNSSSAMLWLRENGPVYGWDNPQWARRGGSGPYEPWHWEFALGTTALGTNWDNR